MSLRALLALLVAATLAAVIAWPRGNHPAPPPAPTNASRIVSLVPSVTEILFDLGLGDRVVGVTTYCTRPPEAQKKAIVGDFTSPNIERILDLHPDAVFEAESHATALEKLRGAGLPVVTVRIQTLAEVLEDYDIIGRTAGVPQKAAERRKWVEGRIAEEESRWKGRPRLKVALVIGRQPGSLDELYVAGTSSFVSDFAARVGGENVFGDVTDPFRKVSPESFLERAPDVILEFVPGADAAKADADAKAAWARLATIPAVANGRIRVLTADGVLSPGPGMADTVRAIGEALR